VIPTKQYPIDRASLERDCVEEFFIASGRAYERMAERLEKLQHRPARRIPTRPSTAGRERRLQRKRRTGLIKQWRTATHPDEE